MTLQAVRRLREVRQQRTSIALRTLFVVALAAAGLLGFAQPAHAAALPFGDTDDCESLAQAATASRANATPRPFDAAQIPGSPTFTFTNASGDTAALVACQQEVINANPAAPYGV